MNELIKMCYKYGALLIFPVLLLQMLCLLERHKLEQPMSVSNISYPFKWGIFACNSEDTWKAVQIVLVTGLIVGLLSWQHWCHFELMNERNLYYRVLPSPHGLTRHHRTKQSKTNRVMHVFSSNKTKIINKKGNRYVLSNLKIFTSNGWENITHDPTVLHRKIFKNNLVLSGKYLFFTVVSVNYFYVWCMYILCMIPLITLFKKTL